MNELERFVVWVGIFFREILRAIFDVICVLVLLLSFLLPWRWPAIFKSLGEVGSRGDFEGACFMNVGMTAADVFTLPFASTYVPSRHTFAACLIRRSRRARSFD